MTHKVVAHRLDGALIKGVCLSVDPSRPGCRIQTPTQLMVDVAFAELKALFFVRTFEGNPDHDEANSLAPDDPRRIGSRVIELEFHDGERLLAITPQFPPTKALFYVLPADPDSNNDRVLVNRAACRSMTVVPG